MGKFKNKWKFHHKTSKGLKVLMNENINSRYRFKIVGKKATAYFVSVQKYLAKKGKIFKKKSKK